MAGTVNRTKINEETPESEAHDEENLTPVIRLELYCRNVLVVAACVLFLLSIITGHASGTRKVIAYLCGALAYVFEYLHLTKGFRSKIPHKELFMVYCFGPLYLLMGLSYIIHR